MSIKGFLNGTLNVLHYTSPLWWATKAIAGNDTADKVSNVGYALAGGYLVPTLGAAALGSAGLAAGGALTADGVTTGIGLLEGAAATGSGTSLGAAQALAATGALSFGGYTLAEAVATPFKPGTPPASSAESQLTNELNGTGGDSTPDALVPSTGTSIASQVVAMTDSQITSEGGQLVSDVTGNPTTLSLNGSLMAVNSKDSSGSLFGACTYSGSWGSAPGLVYALNNGLASGVPTGGVFNQTTLGGNPEDPSSGKPWYEYTVKTNAGNYMTLGSSTQPTIANGKVNFNGPTIMEAGIPTIALASHGTPVGSITPPWDPGASGTAPTPTSTAASPAAPAASPASPSPSSSTFPLQPNVAPAATVSTS